MSESKVLTKKIAKGKVAFEIAPDELVKRHEEEIGILLEILGHPEALVTDETTLSFFPLDDEKLKKIRRASKTIVGSHVTLVRVAELIRKARSERKKSKGARDER
jgi:hypothetical protein